MVDIGRIHRKVEARRQAMACRDEDIQTVRLVRAGRMNELFPSLFADESNRPIVGNKIDQMARDVAELMAPLPALACASGNMRTQADERRASVKNKIGSYYWKESHLAVQNINFADAINCYSFGSYVVEPDFDISCPKIRWESSFNAYYVKDKWGRLAWWAKFDEVTCDELCAQYPDYEYRICNNGTVGGRVREGGEIIKIVRYFDLNVQLVYLPECENLVLASAPNPLSRVPVVVAERPDNEAVPRGQYDDVVPVEMARTELAQNQMKAVDWAVNAPVVVPDDVTDLSHGPDAVIRTAQGAQSVGKVQMRLPPDVYQVAQDLQKATEEGSRYPGVRTGGIKGNIITGRGVQELMGTMDTQIQTTQTIIGYALEEVTSICFEMDVVLWGNRQKTITGVLTGKPFEITYTPSQAVGVSYGCKVTYGFAAGLSPSQAMVALLQLQGGGVVSTDTVRRQLPFDIDPEEEQRSIDYRAIEEAQKQGLLATLQAIGPMIAQGQSPFEILHAGALVADRVRSGSSVTDAMLEAFKPPEPPPGAEEGAMPGPAGEPGEQMPGTTADGRMLGVPYGQQGSPPGGMPAVNSLMAQMRGDRPEMSAAVIRKKAVGSG